MKLNILIIISIFFISCQKQNSGFDLTNKETLKIQLQKFINDINEGKTSQFQDSTINWWNYSTTGKVNAIQKNTSLNCIKQLNNLKIDSLKINGDTIFGLVHEEPYKCFMNNTDTLCCITKNKINLIVKNGKIKEIINQSNIISNHIIIIGGFYMDESEITSNEYREFIPTPITKQKSDSINNYYHIHKNDYELIQDCE